MAWVDAIDFMTAADDTRERQLGPANPRDLLLMIAADRDSRDALPDVRMRCEGCGAAIMPGSALCDSCSKRRREAEQAKKIALGGKCIDCHIDISDRGNSARRCIPCADKHHKERQQASVERNRQIRLARPRFCAECGTDITDRGPTAKFCEPCRWERQKKAMRDYQARLRAERTEAA